MRRGFPIRISTDQSLLAAPHGFSQRATSFIASQCQGIHQMPFSCLIQDASCSHSRSSKTPSRAQGRTPTPRTGIPLRYGPFRTRAPRRRPKPTPGRPARVHGSLHLFTCPRSADARRRTPRRTPPCRQEGRGSWQGNREPLLAATNEDRCPPVPKDLRKPAGGGERDRTDDLMLAKHALSQLSYAPEDRLRPSSGSSRRAIRFAPLKRKTRTHQTSKPTERDRREPIQQRANRRGSSRAKPDRPCDPRTGGAPAKLVGQGGLEPPTSRLSSARSNQLSY